MSLVEEHHVEQHAKRPDIDLGAEELRREEAVDLLGRSVRCGRVFRNVLLGGRDLLAGARRKRMLRRRTEVAQLESLLRVDEHVLHLDVAMNDRRLEAVMQFGDRRAHRQEDLQRLFETLMWMLLHIFAQVSV